MRRRLAGVAIGSLLALLAAGAAAAQGFVDVTAASGVGYVQSTLADPPGCLLAAGNFCEPERMSGGAAVADYDGDGAPDLYVTRIGAPGILFRNRGDGTFEDATVPAGLGGEPLTGNGAAWADVDNDGDPDLYVSSIGGTRYHLFMNQGGTFTEEALARGAAVATADPHLGYGIAFGDYDRDGWLDLFVAEWRPSFLAADPSSSHSRLLRNRGLAAPGHFEDVTDAAGVALAVLQPGESWAFAPAFTDLDGDGWPELAIAADFGTSRLFWNQQDGSFLDGTATAGVGTDENGMGSTFGDYDGDGDLDWFVTSIFDPLSSCQTGNCGWGDSGNRLYRNDGGRLFSDQTGSAASGVRNGHWGWGTAFFDFDNDGDLDLVMTNGVDFPEAQLVPPTLDDPWLADPMRLWRNDGGAWTEVSAAVGLTDTGPGKGLLTFDYDADGDLDLFVVNTGSGGRLLRNDGGNALSWLRVEARGRASNRESHGARVEVTLQSGGATQVREIGAASHFLGQSERTAHFGLGTGTAPVHQVRVHWPKKNRTRIWNDVPRNTTLLAEEPRRLCGLLGPEALIALALHGARRRARSRAA